MRKFIYMDFKNQIKNMKRKKELYEEIRVVEKELKELASIVNNETFIPSQDEIHGWAIQMDYCINRLKVLREEVLEFYSN